MEFSIIANCSSRYSISIAINVSIWKAYFGEERGEIQKAWRNSRRVYIYNGGGVVGLVYRFVFVENSRIVGRGWEKSARQGEGGKEGALPATRRICLRFISNRNWWLLAPGHPRVAASRREIVSGFCIMEAKSHAPANKLPLVTRYTHAPFVLPRPPCWFISNWSHSKCIQCFQFPYKRVETDLLLFIVKSHGAQVRGSYLFTTPLFHSVWKKYFGKWRFLEQSFENCCQLFVISLWVYLLRIYHRGPGDYYWNYTFGLLFEIIGKDK